MTAVRPANESAPGEHGAPGERHGQPHVTEPLLLELGVTLHPEDSLARKALTAVLAQRLGYTEAWVEAQEPGVAEAVTTVAATGGIRVGVHVAARVPADLPFVGAGLVVEVDDGDGRAELWRATGADVRVGRPLTDDLDHVVLHTADPEAVRRQAGLDVTVAVPLAIGRTRSEAVARADRDPRFVGDRHPEVSGIFGTFEQAQQQVLALAEAGASRLIVTLAHELDVADLLAQTRALVVGATPALLAKGEWLAP